MCLNQEENVYLNTIMFNVFLNQEENIVLIQEEMCAYTRGNVCLYKRKCVLISLEMHV